jgi:hypothetical protein
MAFIDRAVPEKEVWQGKDPPIVVVLRGAELQGQHIPVRTAEARKSLDPAGRAFSFLLFILVSFFFSPPVHAEYILSIGTW